MGICCISEHREKQELDNTLPQKGFIFHSDSISQSFVSPPFPNRNPNKSKSPVINQGDICPYDESFPAIPHSKSKNDISLIHSSLSKHFLFHDLTLVQQSKIIETMNLYSFAPGQTIIEQSKPGNNFYIISSGQCEVLINSIRVNILSQGDSFGELALLTNKPRTATVKSLESTFLWALDRTSFREAVKSINETHYETNESFIKQLKLFDCLTSLQKEVILTSVTSVKYDSGQKIVKEGEAGELFFIIKQGTVECSVAGKVNRTIGAYEYFGELAFLNNKIGSETVVAITDTECLVISVDQLTQALGSQLGQIIHKNSLKIAFARSQVLSSLAGEVVKNIIEGVSVQTFEDGAVVIERGLKKKEFLFVLLNGKLNEKSENFSVFDEEEFLKQKEGVFPEIKAVGNVDLGKISFEAFNIIIGGNLSQLTFDYEILKVFKKISFLRGLSSEKLTNLIKYLQIESFNAGQNIFFQGSEGDSFYIVKSGKVDIIKDDVLIRQINKFDYFGERSILFNELRTATVRAYNKVECWVLRKSEFFLIIDEKIRLRLKYRIELQDDNITLDDLVLIKKLGFGQYGMVQLCAHKNNKNLYALKSIERDRINNKKIQESLVLERKILMQLDHSFILKLIKTFKDSQRIYFLTEYVRGQDLFDVIRKIGLLSNEDSLFYTGCLFIIFEHLHERDIVYRDLKPENVMVDDEGYPKLIDFGTAKIVQGRTYTMIGTPHYMAPEVILGKGYSITADYWSIGIMLYEFFCGGVPFGENENEISKIYEKILEGKFSYPYFANLPNQAKKMIEQLLSKNPTLRITGGIENVKTHPWLKGFDWEAICDRTAVVPYKPKIINLELEKMLNSKSKESFIIPKESCDPDPSTWDAVF